MRSVVKALRAFDTEFVEWREAAGLKGESFNAWARRSLHEAAKLDVALAKQEDEKHGEAGSEVGEAS